MVTETPFEKLRTHSERKVWEGVEATVPKPAHLVALKLHAIKQPYRESKEKDWSDVIALIRGCRLSLDDGNFRGLIERYGGPDAETEIRKRLSSGGR